MSHYIADGGPFARACAELIRQGFDVLYVELWSDREAPQEEGREQDEIHLPGLRRERMGKAGRSTSSVATATSA